MYTGLIVVLSHLVQTMLDFKKADAELEEENSKKGTKKKPNKKGKKGNEAEEEHKEEKLKASYFFFL